MNKSVSSNNFDFKTDSATKKAHGALSVIEGSIYRLPSGKEAFKMKSEKTGNISIWVKDIVLLGGKTTVFKPLFSSMEKNPGLSGWKLYLK